MNPAFKKQPGSIPTRIITKPIRRKFDIVLSAECADLAVNSQSQKVCSIKNDRSKTIKITEIAVVYKTGLEDVLIEIKRSGANGELVTGLTQISVVGRDRTKDRTSDFPVEILLGDTLEIELWVKTKTVALNKGDICISLLGEYA